MVNTVLTKAGFVKDKTYKETRFLKPPKSTYAIYLDSYARRGGDGCNLITEHIYTIEVYCYAPDPKTEAKIEAVFDELGIPYEKDPRYWVQEEQLYQVIYTFNYIEK